MCIDTPHGWTFTWLWEKKKKKKTFSGAKQSSPFLCWFLYAVYATQSILILASWCVLTVPVKTYFSKAHLHLQNYLSFLMSMSLLIGPTLTTLYHSYFSCRNGYLHFLVYAHSACLLDFQVQTLSSYRCLLWLCDLLPGVYRWYLSFWSPPANWPI